MATRAMWKGVIQLGQKGVPVKLFAAVEDTHIHFHLLHAGDGVRVEQHSVHPESGQEVPAEQVRRGYPVRPGVFVVLTDKELEALEPKPSRDIEVTSFVPDRGIPAAWFERPYHLGPDGDAEAYFALAEALRRQHREGIARWVMRGKRYTGALRCQGDHLVLIALRNRNEVLQAPEIEVPKTRAPSAQELALAEQLVSALAGELDPTAFRSEYRERVHELVEKKAAGEPIAHAKARSRKPTLTSLQSVLAASVKLARPHPPSHKERKSA